MGRDIIYCLVGPSGSGKTTIARLLKQEGYNVIQSYTTRPPRSADEWGYTFVTFKNDEPAPWADPDVIAHNVYNGHHYWATKQQYENKGKTIYIIDPPGDKQLRELVDCRVVTIFLRAGRDICFHRIDIDRDREQALKRVEHDAKMFACVKTDYVIDAELPINEVVKHIKTIAGESQCEN